MSACKWCVEKGHTEGHRDHYGVAQERCVQHKGCRFCVASTPCNAPAPDLYAQDLRTREGMYMWQIVDALLALEPSRLTPDHVRMRTPLPGVPAFECSQGLASQVLNYIQAFSKLDPAHRTGWPHNNLWVLYWEYLGVYLHSPYGPHGFLALARPELEKYVFTHSDNSPEERKRFVEIVVEALRSSIVLH
jgi:hypothetical protein